MASPFAVLTLKNAKEREGATTVGLDMYAYKVPKHHGNTTFNISDDIPQEDRRQFAYWRKFNALHGWMERRAREAGWTEEFNVVPFKLDAALLDQLESELDILEPVQGFFFGAQEVHPDDVRDAKTFIEEARSALDLYDVYYNSWW